MKNLILAALVISTISFSTFAQEATPSTLAAVMKSMKTTLKKLTPQVNNPQANPDSLKLAQELLNMTENSKKFVPDTISSLPKDQQQVQLDKYLKLIDELVQMEKDLVLAFQNNDNLKAADIVTKMDAIKKEGHDQFKN